MAAFPTTLPEPLLSNYVVEPQAVSIRTDMDAGAARVRRRFTQQVRNVDVAWTLLADQMEDFIDFYENDIDFGVAWFDMTLDFGAGNASHECRFIDRYAARPLGGGLWMVVAQIETRT